jgi:hypothetical protein
VLAGHPTTPLGEIQQGAFRPGSRREDGFFFVQMVVLHFHQGVPITPATPPTLDLFDPALVLWAIHRGASSKVDMDAPMGLLASDAVDSGRSASALRVAAQAAGCRWTRAELTARFHR